ncbi:hypothetical protein CC2G_011952 [Coprinopsis cinerea AmutBmut pab1-1]|nr:hypothetical protein CC2G_011952 [Coprinopsis cinerea AmutBmut pab1-1]
MANLEKRRLKVSTGSLPSDKTALETLPFHHPFVSQVDVVFPENITLANALSKLETRYVKGRTRLSVIVVNGDSFGSGEVTMLTTNTVGSSQDVWCIDPRGVLSLCVCKETYESLGIVGKPLPFKGRSDQHVIQIPLRKSAVESTKAYAKTKASSEAWEERRAAQERVEGWEVVYCSRDHDRIPELSTTKDAEVRQVRCKKRESTDVYIPSSSLGARPTLAGSKGKKPASYEDEIEDWNRDLMDLFEWAGLAALNSPRISARDRADPYIAVYEPPQPSSVGNVTHLCWRGLLAPTFVHTIIEQTCKSIESQASTAQKPIFAFITVHGVTTIPISYLSPGGEGKEAQAFVRLPRQDTEDTWSLLVNATPSGGVSWTLLECIGQWDTRWG